MLMGGKNCKNNVIYLVKAIFYWTEICCVIDVCGDKAVSRYSQLLDKQKQFELWLDALIFLECGEAILLNHDSFVSYLPFQ